MSALGLEGQVRIAVNNRKILDGVLERTGLDQPSTGPQAMTATILAFMASGQPGRRATCAALADAVKGSARGEEGCASWRKSPPCSTP